MKQYLSL